jgi:protein O-mannosyl-transferase
MSSKDRKQRGGRPAKTTRYKGQPGSAPVTVTDVPPAPAPARGRVSSWMVVAILVALVALNLAVFAPVRHYDFIQLDDPAQVSENTNVAGGLTWAGVAWAFTSARAGYWMPLVWLSHMLDVQLYGMNAGPHHVTNLVLHIACTLLLFGLLLRMTGAAGRSAFVAALFAVHPLHVESVAWITERKDVLSTVFWMLTLWAYVAYVRRPERWRYGLVCVSFALGLMAKPMLVTLPAVMLLLDVWPLGRLGRREAGDGRREAEGGRREWGPVIREKIPLLALAMAAGIVAFLTQRGSGAVGNLEVFPLGLRVQNALVSYVAYLGKMVWPTRLTAFYPYPASLPAWSVAGSALLLIVVSVAAWRAARSVPYLAVGWFWYLGTLVPVIGVVQVGIQSMADRFTYVPLVGIFIAIAWGVPDALGRWRVPGRRTAVPALAAAIVIACAVGAHVQVAYWQDSVAMWTRTTEIAMNTDAYHAHIALGQTLRAQGRMGEAIGHFSEAVRLQPASSEAQYELGATLASQGREDEAIARLLDAVRLRPDFAEAHIDLGALFSRRQKTDEAIAHYQAGLRIRPDLAEAHNNLGALLAGQGRMAEALPHFADAVRLKPDFEYARVNLGLALASAGRSAEALHEFEAALRINPANDTARRAADGLRRR